MAVPIEQPSLEDRVIRELSWRADGLKFRELRHKLGVPSNVLHAMLVRMWGDDLIRRIPGQRDKCRYVLTRIRPDVPGKGDYRAATTRATHNRDASVAPHLDEAVTYRSPVQTADEAVAVLRAADGMVMARQTCWQIAELLTEHADQLMAEAQSDVKLAAALVEWAKR